MLSLDSSVFIQIVSLAVFCLLMKRFLFDPVHRILAQRRKGTEERLKSANELAEEARKLEADWKRRLEEGRRETALQKDEIRRATREEEERIVRVAREESEKTLLEVRRSIQTETEKARSALQREAEELSRAIVERMMA